MILLIKILLIFLFGQISIILAFPDQGKWDFEMSGEHGSVTIPKSLYAGSKIFVRITCESNIPNTDIEIAWFLSQTLCWEDYINFYDDLSPVVNESLQIKSKPIVEQCNQGINIPLKEYKFSEVPQNNDHQLKSKMPTETAGTNVISKKSQINKRSNPGSNDGNPVFTITKDGVYLFTFQVSGNSEFHANVHVELRGDYGYLSAADWPLLPFYGVMCLVYVIFGVIWLAVSFLQWRDLLRIQFWIGGVILLGMLEKATFYAEYQSINSNGESVRGAVLLAEWVSCAKRTLARMLVIIVSLGFGIVKPRLGPMLHRVVGTGTLYFVLACVESYLRVMHTKNDPSNQILLASIPLAVLDSAICWWIFTSLVQTTRTLRLRRNMVKLALYRHFTNTLIFAVLASIIFMLFSIKAHRLAHCLKDWKDLWQDEAFWHVLFSSLLLVIMILWRPTNNNQRYAFTPLLDNPEDEDDDDDEEDQFVSDAFGVKMRGTRNSSPKTPATTANKTSTTEEDDLRWVEENIPTAIADATLPVLDSDEEIINTKFEVSKMQ